MKKSTIALSSFLAGALLMTSVSGVLANTLERVSAFINNEIKINVNGQEAKLANPVITYNNSTYVSVREIGGLVGSDIKWDGANKSVEIKTDELVNAINTEYKDDYTTREVIELLSEIYEDLDFGYQPSANNIIINKKNTREYIYIKVNVKIISNNHFINKDEFHKLEKEVAYIFNQ